MKPVLPFEKLPKGLLPGGKILYCVVDISGIQSYIFHPMDRYTTPERIRCRSQYVGWLTQYLCQKLSEVRGMIFVSASGGKILCGFPLSVKEKDLRTKLDALQRAVFASTKGKLTFYYAMCRAKCILQNRFNGEKELLAGAYLGQLLERQKYHCTNLLSVDMKKDSDAFLIPAEPEEKAEEKCRDMGVVKLDLDNLGAFFRDILAFDRRHLVSMALEKEIDNCLRADARIETIFAGGDDIFFLCPLNEYLSTVCGFYRSLKSSFENNEYLKGYATDFFGISAGVSALRNRLDSIPVLSYWESAESALSAAKTQGSKNCVYIKLPDGEKLSVRWDDLCFLSDIYSLLKEPLHRCHRFGGADLINVNLLCDQLLICGKSGGHLTKKEQNRLYEIKKRSV